MNPYERIASLEADLKNLGQAVLKMQATIKSLRAEIERLRAEKLELDKRAVLDELVRMMQQTGISVPCEVVNRILSQ